MQKIFELFRHKILNKKLSSNNKINFPSAFSLIELAIVILIIGILILGISQGYNLVRSAQISNARGITSKSPVSSYEDLLIWYETSLRNSLLDAETKDTGQLTKWKDISPSSILVGNNIASTTATNNISYLASGINKIPSVKFSGSGSKFSLSNFVQGASSQTTIFIVFRPTYSPSATYSTIFDNASSSTYSISINNSSVQLNNGISANYTYSFALNRDYILGCYFNRSNSQVFVNTITGVTSATALTGTNSLIGASIGNSFAGDSSFNGLISEVIVFNRIIKESERKEIFYYLGKKYKIDVIGI